MNLDDYLARINYSGPRTVCLNTLRQVHRHHLLALPYEDLDVQLGRPLTTDVAAAYDKIVHQGRGGWCYEMNGVLGWALQELGFSIQRTSGGVNRHERGDDTMGTHLVLLTELEGKTYIVDAGFGDGFLYPPELKEGIFTERGYEFRLELLQDGHWRMHNHKDGGAPSFDFTTDPASEERLENRCQHLQTFEQSPFVMVLIAQRLTDEGYELQIGRVAKRVTPEGVQTKLLDSPEQLLQRLHNVFGLDVPEVADLWPVIVERHEQLFGTDAE